MTKPLLALDTETCLIGPGAVAPKLICSSLAFEKEGKIISRLIGNGDSCLLSICKGLLEPGHILVGHNISYDIGVLVSMFPELEPLVWEKMENKEISDTLIREMLLNLSTHGDLNYMRRPDGSKEVILYGLDALVWEYFQANISDSKHDADSPRMRYSEMDGRQAANYDEEFKSYALEDAEWPILLYKAQRDKVESESGYSSLSTDWFHTNASIALFFITMRGMATDPVEFAKMQKLVMQEISEEKMKPLYDEGFYRRPVPAIPHVRCIKAAQKILDVTWDKDDPRWGNHQEILEEQGIVFKKSSLAKKHKAPLHKYIEAVCAKNGLEVRRNDPTRSNPEGSIKSDSESIDLLAGLDRSKVLAKGERTPLQAYQNRQKIDKILSTEIPRMMWPSPKIDPANAKLSDVVHFPYKTLVKTTRTSSSASSLYPSANGQNVDPRARPSYRARDGFVLSSRDYASLELCTVAQTTYSMFGESVHRDRINAGYDLHGYLGSQLALALDPDFRSLCHRKKIHDAPSRVYSAFMSCKGHKDPRVAKFFARWRKFAKPVGLGFPGGLGPQTFIGIAMATYGVDIVAEAMEMPESELVVSKSLLWHISHTFKMSAKSWSWNPLLKGFALAIMLKDIWLATYPEMVAFFERVKDTTDLDNKGKLCYTSPMGMHRAGADFCAAANGTGMQTPSAEGAKHAVINVVRAFRYEAAGSCLFGQGGALNFIHDEILTELTEALAAELDAEVGKIMEETMREHTPDVVSATEGVLMRNWHKFADPVFNDLDLLVPWEPGIEYENKGGKLYLPN